MNCDGCVHEIMLGKMAAALRKQDFFYTLKTGLQIRGLARTSA